MRDVVQALDVPFDWHIKTVPEVLQGTPTQIQAAYRQAVADGAPEMVCELTVGTLVENIRAFIDVAEDYVYHAVSQVRCLPALAGLWSTTSCTSKIEPTVCQERRVG